MNAISYLEQQLTNIHAMLRAIAGDLTDEEWVARAAPGLNFLGATVWHIPRTQDLHVQTWIRGVPQVAHRERWAHWQPLQRLGTGAGISLAEADEIARSVRRAEVLEYAAAVHEETQHGLRDLNDTDLDQVPDIAGHLAPFPEYQTPGFVAEARGLFNQPIWAQLMRPCIGHVHRHLGEVEVLKEFLRRPA